MDEFVFKSRCISFSLDKKDRMVFLKGGFYPNNAKSSPFHRHHYAEVHMVLDGECRIWVENEYYSLIPGQILLIPAKMYHGISSMEKNTVHSAFGIDFGCAEIVCRSMNLSTMRDFFEEIKASVDTSGNSRLLSYILLVCSLLVDSFVIESTEISQDRFLISEFFSERYHENVQVSDLAKELHLSEKQTQLLVKRYLGRTFKQELTETRMKVASYLVEYTDMSMTEIASKIGFQTYGGFWKVFKAYQGRIKSRNSDKENS